MVLDSRVRNRPAADIVVCSGRHLVPLKCHFDAGQMSMDLIMAGAMGCVIPGTSAHRCRVARARAEPASAGRPRALPRVPQRPRPRRGLRRRVADAALRAALRAEVPTPGFRPWRRSARIRDLTGAVGPGATLGFETYRTHCVGARELGSGCHCATRRCTVAGVNEIGVRSSRMLSMALHGLPLLLRVCA